MANNRDNKYGAKDETEYHFSDDEVTYEVEPEEHAAPEKPAPVQSAASRFLSDWSTRKRLGMSVAAFLVLLFIVYKIISPGGATKDAIAPLANNNAVPVSVVAPKAPNTNMANAPVAPIASQAAVAAAPISMAPPTQVSGSPMPSSAAPVSPVNQMPPVMPVTTPAPAYPASSATVENGSNQLTSINNQLVSQMQADYTQKVADVMQQNKQLEEEVQKLNASVTSIEARMNQLVQLMVKQQADAQQTKEESPVQSASPAAPKLPYTVQAIIPGRAWLRADNGDTLTVTEGDTIKDVGKVTKIDPYDGVIEINTGRKVVSLSYGNGG